MPLLPDIHVGLQLKICIASSSMDYQWVNGIKDLVTGLTAHGQDIAGLEITDLSGLHCFVDSVGYRPMDWTRGLC